ncbi:MAG: tetratricopeptide repeat protein [Ignavibacteriaceae bacterium]
MTWKIIVVLGLAVASFFIPTPVEMQNAFTSGQNYYASNNYKKAIEQFDLIIDTESDFLNEDSVKVTLFNGDLIVRAIDAALYQKGNALKSLGLKDSAISIYRIVEAQGREPELATLSQFMIYDIFYRSGEFQKAIDEAIKLAEKYPQHKKAESALYDIGWAYRETGNLEKSREYFYLLKEKYPETDYLARAIYQLGQNSFDLKKYDDAIKYWTELNDKFKPEAFKDKDWENVQLKTVKERQIFEATAGRETDESTLELVAKAQLKIGDCYREKGEYDVAMVNYRKIVTNYSLLPVLVEVSYIKMADYALSEKGVDEAMAIYHKAIDDNFANKELQAKMQYMIADTYQKQGEYDKAAKEYLFYIKAYPDVAETIQFGVDKAQYTVVAMYYNARNYESAAKEADTLLLNFPNSEAIPATLFLQGLSRIETGDFALARTTLTRLVEKYPQSPDLASARIQIGFTYFKEGAKEKALDEYLNVLKDNPADLDSSHLFFELVNVYSEIKRFDEAISAFENIKTTSQYFTPGFGKIVKIFGQRSEYDKGIAFLNSIIEKNRGKDSTYLTSDINFAFADLYISKNDYKTAIDYLTKVVDDSLLPESKSILKHQSRYARGVLNYQIENYPQAVSDLEYCLSDNDFLGRFPNFVKNANEKLALSYSKTGKKEKAIELANSLMAKAKDEKEKGTVYNIIAGIYYEAGDHKQAIETCKNVIKTPGLDEETLINAYITMSNSYKGLNDMANAASTLLEASEKFPESPEIPTVLYTLGAMYFDSQEYERSAGIFSKFVDKYPKHVNVKEARYFKAYSYYETGNWTIASSSFRQYVANYPDDPAAAESQFYAGEALYNSKDYNGAMVEYRKTYQRYSSTDYAPMAMYNEGWCYFELKQPEKMIDVFSKLATRFPKSTHAGDALFTIGDYYYNTKDYVKSSEAYTALISKFPNYEKIEEAKTLVYDLSQINSYLEYEKAMKLFDARDYQKAIEELTKLFNKYPDASIAVGCQVNIAASYEMLEEFQDAAKWYRQIINKYSKSEDDNERSAVFFAKEHLDWIEENY